MGFTNPLFVTFSHRHTASALRHLVERVRPVDGTVTALAVIEPPPALQRLLTPHDTAAHVDEVLQAELQHDLEDWVAAATGERHPHDVRIAIAHGHQVGEVLHRIVEEDHDLLALTSDPGDPAARAIIKRLQRKSPCPVWAIRPSRARKVRVLAALDTDPDHHGLDHRILEAAAWLTPPSGELHVATAWELLGESTLRSSPFLSTGPDTIDALRDQCADDHRHTLEELVSARTLPTEDVRLHVVNGRAPEVITDLVERFAVNQLVLGTIGRTGIPGFVVGNTAEQLLEQVTCSVLAVKPPGWVSPIHG